MHNIANLRDVDIDAPSVHSSDSGNFKDDVQMVLSSSSHHPPQVVWNEDEEGPMSPHVPMKREEYAKLPLHVFFWHFLCRATLSVFVILNDRDKHQDTPFLIFLVATLLSLLNMLLLCELKLQKHNHVACAFAMYSSLESCILVFLPDFLLYAIPALFGAWLCLLGLSMNPCRPIYRWYTMRLHKNMFEYTRSEPPIFLFRHQYTRLCMFWALVLSILTEGSNLVYFWFLMHSYEHEQDGRKQRIILCCVHLKLLFTTYARHILFARKFSFISVGSELILFATISSIVYAYTFFTLTGVQILILRYTFWSALGLEVLVNFIHFVRFSANAF